MRVARLHNRFRALPGDNLERDPQVRSREMSSARCPPCCTGSVHLSRLDLTNFRSCRETIVQLRPGLTVLVGENNSGKSSIIDALRLVTLPTDGRRSRYCEPGDFSFGAENESIDIRATYAGLSPSESAMFIEAMTGPDATEIAYRMRYSGPGPQDRRGSYVWTVGNNDGDATDRGGRDRLRHVYLPPLRDAEAALASGSGERIEFVLRTLSEDDEIEHLELSAVSAFGALEGHEVVARADSLVRGQLDDLSRGAMPQRAALGFVAPTLRELARALRFRLGEVGLDPVDLRHSGLGYANLLFLATVLVELDAIRDSDLTLFLVEEPEAHLHPQLQAVVLSLLESVAASSVQRGGPSVQVVVSTHSAQLAASVSVENVVVVKPAQRRENNAEEFDATAVVPVWELRIDAEALAKVDRYINATRSPILFGPRIVLVEGLAEALLLPVLAQRVLSDAVELSRFRAIALCPIGGVDFEPYIRLLLSPFGGRTVAERVVVITDTDPKAPGDRPAALRDLAAELGASERLAVTAAPISLEADLYNAGNVDILRRAFLDQRSRSQHRLDDLISVEGADRGAAFAELISSTQVAKGQLAQFVAARIEAGDDIQIPAYLRCAIVAATRE